MTKEIRITGLNPSANIFVQFKERGEWNQVRMPLKDFAEMMKTDFPKYWKEYEQSGADDFGTFFYYYGYENGETFVFKNE